MLNLEQLIRFAKAIPLFGGIFFLNFLLYSLTNTGTFKQRCPSAMTCLMKIVFRHAEFAQFQKENIHTYLF